MCRIEKSPKAVQHKYSSLSFKFSCRTDTLTETFRMAHTSFLKFRGQALLSEMDGLNDLASCVDGSCSSTISTILGVEGQTSLSLRHNNLHNNKQEAGEKSICVFSGT